MAKKRSIQYNDATTFNRPDLILEAWIGRHWKQIMFVCFALVFMTVMWAMVNVNGLKNSVKQQALAIENLSKRVIVATPDGRVVILQTIDIPDSYVIMILRDIINRYLIFSSFEIQTISNNDVQKFSNYEKIKEFNQHFCEGQKCKNDYKAFISLIWNAYKEGTLPEVLYTGGSKSVSVNETYKVQDKNFYYSVVIPVTTYTVKENKWIRGEGNIEFTLQGEINLQVSSPQNPWGLKITTFKATVPLKQFS